MRARDAAGNVSSWTADRCTITPVDDRALTTRATRLKGASYYLGTVSRSTVSRTVLTPTRVTATRVGVLVTTCTTCGYVDVTLGGHSLGRINTHAATTRSRQVLWLPTRLLAGTLVLRTVTRSQVLVDGVVLQR